MSYCHSLKSLVTKILVCFLCDIIVLKRIFRLVYYYGPQEIWKSSHFYCNSSGNTRGSFRAILLNSKFVQIFGASPVIFVIFFKFLVPRLYGRGTLVLGFETSLNSHFIISLNPLKGEAHVEAHVEVHVFKGLEAWLFNTTHRSGMARNGLSHRLCHKINFSCESPNNKLKIFFSTFT